MIKETIYIDDRNKMELNFPEDIHEELSKEFDEKYKNEVVIDRDFLFGRFIMDKLMRNYKK